jgi:hypothetical protein
MRTLLALSLTALLLVPALARAQDSTGAWSLDRYGELSAEMALADDERTLAASGTPEWSEATHRAINVRREIIAMIARAFHDGSLPEELREPATGARLLLIQNIVVLLSNLGDCDQAAAAIRLLDDAAGSDDAELQLARVTADEAAAECRRAAETETVADAEPPIADDTTAGTETTDDLLAPPPPRPGRGRRTAGIVLTGLGTALAAGGLAWDAANAAGPRSEFDRLAAKCPEDCDTERLDALEDDIHAARAPIGALLFGGIGVGTTGALLWITAPRQHRSELAVSPSVAPGFAGLRVRAVW